MNNTEFSYEIYVSNISVNVSREFAKFLLSNFKYKEDFINDKPVDYLDDYNNIVYASSIYFKREEDALAFKLKFGK